MCNGGPIAAVHAELLAAAARNDAAALRLLLAHAPLPLATLFRWRNPKTDEVQARTLLQVAAFHGAVAVVLELLLAGADANDQSPLDRCTALHAAVEGGSAASPLVVNILLKCGADPDAADAFGRRPADLVSELMAPTPAAPACAGPKPTCTVDAPTDSCASSADNSELEKEEYKTDDFRMFSFKVAECCREDAHDWTECPFAHPGEKARRRDPRVFTYNGTACPDFRKGTCKRGDTCPYAHGVFECWLHPSKYRTQLCKDGPGCTRRVCFFAHSLEQLRTSNVEPESPATPTLSASSLADSASETSSQTGDFCSARSASACGSSGASCTHSCDSASVRSSVDGLLSGAASTDDLAGALSAASLSDSAVLAPAGAKQQPVVSYSAPPFAQPLAGLCVSGLAGGWLSMDASAPQLRNLL